MRAVIRVVLIALAASAFMCEGKGPSFFLPGATSPQTGNITGVVSSGTTPIPQAPVKIEGSQSGTTTTDAAGSYSFNNWSGGDVTVTATPVLFNCPPVNSKVQVGVTITVNIPCTATPGTIAGTVRLDGAPKSGVTVTITGNGSSFPAQTTGATGTYALSSVPPGTYTATVTPPANTTCTPTSRSVVVVSGQTATADFDCTTNIPDFQVAFGDPPVSYRHIVAGVSSETCAGITTTPAQPGGAWTMSWSGPGTVGGTTRSGALDANGKAVDRQMINSFGTYAVNASVTIGARVRTAAGSSTVTVTSSPGSCPPP